MLFVIGTQGQGYMPDGTSRISKDGKEIFHFMGCSTFAEYAVIAEISAAKIHPGADLYQMCLLGCGVSTGWGAVFNTVKMEPQKTVAVFSLGALGLSVIQVPFTTRTVERGTFFKISVIKTMLIYS